MERFVVKRNIMVCTAVRVSRLRILVLGVLVGIILTGCENVLYTETQLPVETPSKIEIMGFIRHLDQEAGSVYISFDQAEWFSGPQAEKAILEDGLCSDPEHGCEPPNGFYIRNQDDETVAFQVSDQVDILMQTLSHRPDGSYNSDERIDLDRFRQAVRCACTSHLRLVPYWITLENGVVVTIREQYVP
jgi:hypothetical protein